MDTYVKNHCSKCKKHYYVSLGNLSDMTGVDVEGGICPYCGFGDLFDEIDHDWEPNLEKGVKQLL